MNDFHTPVLLSESINALNINPKGTYVDATFGGGGHSQEILNKLKTGNLIAFEQDKEAVKNRLNDKRLTMINSNFKCLKKQLGRLNITHLDGVFADLGVSSYQFSDNDRGFSLKYDAVIDMRMDKKMDKNGVFILNKYSSEDLNRVFQEHADFKNPKSITSAIINYREKNIIKTTFDFKNIFIDFVNKQFENKFFARLFQAIRMEVNDEVNCLKALLTQAKDLLQPGGRLVVISYHSIEDRIVKNFMKYGGLYNEEQKDFYGNIKKVFQVITKKPICPSNLECEMNNKARSAKLRVCEKI